MHADPCPAAEPAEVGKRTAPCIQSVERLIEAGRESMMPQGVVGTCTTNSLEPSLTKSVIPLP